MRGTFVHLHVHTEYSLVDGIARIRPLVERVAALGMPAVAVTDHGNLFAMVKFYRTAIEAGVKPIVGVDLALAADGARETAGAPERLLLLCQDLEGYRRLARLVTRTYTEGQAHGQPALARAWLDEEGTAGLVAIAPGPAGDVGRAALEGRDDDARRRCDGWRERFGDRFYLAVQRTGRDGEERWIDAAVDLAIETGVALVATNDVRFLAAEDFEAHEARVCIHEGRILHDARRPRRYSDEQHLRGPDEMHERFADLPEAIENAVEVARRCNLDIELGRSYLPDFPVPDGVTLEAWLEGQSRAGLAQRIEAAARTPEPIPPEARPAYERRLAMELAVIAGMGFPGYFLIVADFIRWARENGIPVGPGRGSGAGSLVAYALGITDLDPIRHDLLFERFLNPERVSLPDFDVDFCMEGRDRVIEYVADRYSGRRVAQIITFGTMAAKAVVRDVGRVLGFPYGYVDQLAKLIPFELGMTLERALAEDPLRARYAEDEDVRAIVDLAMKLEGLARNAGRHAGGVVIAPTALTDFTPLYCEPGATSAVTQLDKDDVEAIGLVKFDFLGLRTLTVIDRAVAAINEVRGARGEPPIDIGAIPTDDAAAYELIKRAATTAVFQLESRGMKDLVRRLQPDCFDDVIAINALFRPGPLQSGMVDDFIDRKHGRARVAYAHPTLESILESTYGVILYQEQVMQIAQVLAGYTLGGADLLRRAMGKKKPQEMAEQREVFVTGARERGVEPAQASAIFDLMEKFAGYGFNKSHSAAYALIAYQTAWLKAHHRAAFMAAVLSADMDNTDKVVVLVDECRTLDIALEAPHVNRCERRFSAADEATIRYGLGAIKGAGESAVEAIIAERERGGPYADLFDFCRRVDPRRVNRRVIEALVRAGALDGLGPSRGAMMASLTRALQAAEQHARDDSSGQNDMFGGAIANDVDAPAFVEAAEWDEEELLAGEKDTLGLYLTGHPIARFEDELDRITSARLVDLRAAAGVTRVIAGLVVSLRTIKSRAGRMAVMTLDDRSGRVDVVVYADLFQRHRDLLAKDRLLVVEGEVSDDEFTGGVSVVATAILDLEAARERLARRLVLHVHGCDANGVVRALREALLPFSEGPTPVCIDYRRADAQALLPLGARWAVRPANELIERLRELDGLDAVQVEY